MNQKIQLDAPKRAMVVFAHPDDADVGVSGTVAKWAKQGTEVTYVLCTSGDKGSKYPRQTSPGLMRIREAEQREAAKILGIKNVVFLRFKDAELLPFDLAMRHDIVAAIRQYKPDVVVCQDPTSRYGTAGRGGSQHPDHIAAGEATLSAVVSAAGSRLAFPDLLVQGLPPHTVKEVRLFMAFNNPDYFEDISETIDIKVQALMAHRSQFGEGAAARWKEMAQNTGKPHGLKYAESFKRLQVNGHNQDLLASLALDGDDAHASNGKPAEASGKRRTLARS